MPSVPYSLSDHTHHCSIWVYFSCSLGNMITFFHKFVLSSSPWGEVCTAESFVLFFITFYTRTDRQTHIAKGQSNVSGICSRSWWGFWQSLVLVGVCTIVSSQCLAESGPKCFARRECVFLQSFRRIAQSAECFLRLCSSFLRQELVVSLQYGLYSIRDLGWANQTHSHLGLILGLEPRLSEVNSHSTPHRVGVWCLKAACPCGAYRFLPPLLFIFLYMWFCTIWVSLCILSTKVATSTIILRVWSR